MSPALALVSYVDVSTSSSEEEAVQEGREEEENVPQKGRRWVHRELRNGIEGRQTRQTPESEPQEVLRGIGNREEQAAKSTPQQKKRPREHPSKYRPQQEETGYGPRGRPSLKSSRREEVAPLVRRSSRKGRFVMNSAVFSVP